MIHPRPCVSILCSVVFMMSSVAGVALGQKPAGEAGDAVAQLTSMLKSIDPYQPNEGVDGKVKVFGSTSMDALAHGWTGNFKKFHPNVTVEIAAAGSEQTFDQLAKNPSGVGMLSRPVTDEDLALLKKSGLKNPAAFEVAREALGVFVHKSNPVETISGEQLRAVFTNGMLPGEINWDVLGAKGEWSKKPIHVVSRSVNSGTQKFLADFVFCDCTLRSGVSSHVSNAQVLDSVSKDQTAIAICGLRSTGAAVKALKLTAGNAVIPSDDHAVLSGLYPLTRPLSVVIDLGQDNPDAKASQEFVHFALCRSGQVEAAMVGFFPVDPPLLRAGLQKLGATQLR